MAWPALVILDRDGVINEDSANYIRSPRDWRPIDGSIEALASLHRAGIAVAIATNQSGLARGYFSRATLYRIHAKLRGAVRDAGGDVDCIAYCPHGPNDGCRCRKPAPGLILKILRRLQYDAADAVLIGDSARDLAAAAAAGVPGWLVRTGNGNETLASGVASDVRVFDDLASAVQQLLAEREA